MGSGGDERLINRLGGTSKDADNDEDDEDGVDIYTYR
jgi:hypothetical protein